MDPWKIMKSEWEQSFITYSKGVVILVEMDQQPLLSLA